MQTNSPVTREDFENFKLFIFDLDGTLYDQAKLRRRMVLNLISRIITFRLSPSDLRIISSFRRQRENHKGFRSLTIEKDQYLWCAEELNEPVDRVRTCIRENMHLRPLKHLYKARYPAVEDVFDILKKQKKSIAIYSDHPIKEKMVALCLTADAYFCSTDEELLQLKPSGKAIETICKRMLVPKKESILIGDRDDTDRESAIQAGIAFLKVNIPEARSGKFYTNLFQTIALTHEK